MAEPGVKPQSEGETPEASPRQGAGPARLSADQEQRPHEALRRFLESTSTAEDALVALRGGATPQERPRHDRAIAAVRATRALVRDLLQGQGG